MSTKKFSAGTSYETVKGEYKGKASSYLNRAGYARGGAVGKSDDGEPDMEPKGKKAGGRVKKAEGGEVEGEKSKERMDKFARGGHVKGKGKGSKGGTKVNVIVAPGAGGGDKGGPDPKEAFKAGLLTGAKAGGAGGPPPGAPMPPPPGAGPMMPPPGPGGAPMPPPMKRGGAVKMTAGAGSGEGRMEKSEAAKKEMGRKRGGKC